MAELGKKGCIKTSKGPWIVRKITKDGVITKYNRFPSDRERQNNKLRERKRRSITRKIFAGLKAHGNYNLPKHSDTNDLLRALCEEAGWHVEEDGTIYKKEIKVKRRSQEHLANRNLEDAGYCQCINEMKYNNEISPSTSKISSLIEEYNDNVNLKLSL